MVRPPKQFHGSHPGQHDSRRRGERVERRRHVLAHLARDKELGDERGKGEQQRSPEQTHPVGAHSEGRIPVINTPSTNTSAYDTTTMRNTIRRPSVWKRRSAFRRSTIWPIVMKASTDPRLKFAANARATNASASEQIESRVATGISTRTEATRVPPRATRSPRGTIEAKDRKSTRLNSSH